MKRKKKKLNKFSINILINRMLKEYTKAPPKVSKFSIISDLRKIQLRSKELSEEIKI